MKIQAFTDRIKFLIRNFGGDTDQGFADLLGLGKTTIFRWRTGAALPDGASCILITRKFGVSIDWLLTGEGSMMVENKQPDKPHLTATASQEAQTTNTITEPDSTTRDLLLAAQRVLKADHPTAPAAIDKIDGLGQGKEPDGFDQGSGI